MDITPIIGVTPPEDRPFSLAHLYGFLEGWAPEARENLWDYESAQLKFDASEGQDREAERELQRLAPVLFTRILEVTAKGYPAPLDSGETEPE